MEILGREEFREQYDRWLEDVLGGDGYSELLGQLQSTRFTWVIPEDENRAKDGIDLRHIFEVESGVEYDGDIDEWPASVLEVIVTLSMSANDMDPQGVDHWFWEFLGNLGIGNCDDIWYRETGRSAGALVGKVIDKLLRRSYGRTGEGGLFPRKSGATFDSKSDTFGRKSDTRKWSHAQNQRKVELWYQLNGYMLERQK